jgi:hypothetical protein
VGKAYEKHLSELLSAVSEVQLIDNGGTHECKVRRVIGHRGRYKVSKQQN